MGILACTEGAWVEMFYGLIVEVLSFPATLFQWFLP